MEVKAVYKYARISPLKMRDVAREIQGLPVNQALDILNFTPRKAAVLVGKTLRSAIANAENNFDLDADTLVVKEAQINEGPRFKRFKPRARGGAAPIIKRTSHIRIVVSDEVEIPAPKAKSKGGSKPKAAKAAPTQETAAAEDNA
ncbi:50S ribosomal protein L22 [Sulfuriroseicoccus oceanibius]|uniref:Large ribosomal subunit protein uL22 n=1 Tax=Sulfuriroseicoccus oceanibius TaxID=2707525 RepID=A0A6B3LBY0_9BACT|nr:50S ribosomal protein L22 [Sulfuriroseicoccus oceanibius]QQL45826.1 50S ribosomal protein L22 [Sulfuriroseicoccus oceanibius]